MYTKQLILILMLILLVSINVVFSSSQSKVLYGQMGSELTLTYDLDANIIISDYKWLKNNIDIIENDTDSFITFKNATYLSLTIISLNKTDHGENIYSLMIDSNVVCGYSLRLYGKCGT